MRCWEGAQIAMEPGDNGLLATRVAENSWWIQSSSEKRRSPQRLRCPRCEPRCVIIRIQAPICSMTVDG